MQVRLLDTSRYDGLTVEVPKPAPEVLELPSVDGMIYARQDLLTDKPYRGENVKFHLRPVKGEMIYVAQHLLALHGFEEVK